MENNNKYIAVAYKLTTIDGEELEMVEEATVGKPFQFISGFGVTLDKFEKSVIDLEKGAEFDFTLTSDEAYGEFEEERVLDLDKSIFSINGHFDHENIFVDAIVPLQNEDGNRFMGHVLEITDSTVKMDLNHPLAGKQLNFKGHIVESREATNEEIEGMINRLSGEGCNCGSCNHNHEHGEGGCGHHHEHGEGCCGKHHHDGECSCHHHDE
ncbi:peptidylprolyl isomerase [Prevotella sp. S7 MS 2]|uniref:FKBP-type peptidyl-prolyl cis-trans isomerase n=1 Tax=Prevotella sp. S7 MS 2 TaxID=1287488 RepID=UPI000513CD4F|nr:FKBP-type peptidyl-prolyl cis-trans isomerase [Prevotella sp. S7 MS 2]KGI59635.1 peptidylprolyl isomerase [Prevotella sp. S7 MS 2]